jgi:phosphopantothenoylcysteine decarboxylase/phosphopantothenate--cysteine ligase
MVAAVADWRTANAADQKIKKQAGEAAPSLQMVENPDILATIGHHAQRPHLVVGFAAETQNVVENARKKLDKKGADWIVANNVSFAEDGSSVMGGDHNQVLVVSRDGVDEWPLLDKDEVAQRLAEKIGGALS